VTAVASASDIEIATFAKLVALYRSLPFGSPTYIAFQRYNDNELSAWAVAFFVRTIEDAQLLSDRESEKLPERFSQTMARYAQRVSGWDAEKIGRWWRGELFRNVAILEDPQTKDRLSAEARAEAEAEAMVHDSVWLETVKEVRERLWLNDKDIGGDPNAEEVSFIKWALKETGSKTPMPAPIPEAVAFLISKGGEAFLYTTETGRPRAEGPDHIVRLLLFIYSELAGRLPGYTEIAAQQLKDRRRKPSPNTFLGFIKAWGLAMDSGQRFAIASVPRLRRIIPEWRDNRKSGRDSESYFFRLRFFSYFGWGVPPKEPQLRVTNSD
jgi:hypothetical protein